MHRISLGNPRSRSIGFREGWRRSSQARRLSFRLQWDLPWPSLLQRLLTLGSMDPVFGRGYSEEIDWCLRSHGLGYRSVLAPSCFVFHAGSGVNKVEGLVGGAGDLAHAHQAIIDAVIPSMARRSVRTGRLLFRVNWKDRGLRAMVLGRARERGYRLDVGWLSARPGDEHSVRFVIAPEGENLRVRGSYLGFEATFEIGPEGVLQTLQDLVGSPPFEIRIHDRGTNAQDLTSVIDHPGGIPVRRPAYRERVF